MYSVPILFIGESGDHSPGELDQDFAACLLGINNAFLAGPLGARPAPSNTSQPRYYFATDDRGGTLYREPSDGSPWVQVGASALGAEFVDQFTGLGLAKTSGTSVTVGVGAAVSDDAVILSRLLMNLTTAITGTTGGTWVVGTNQPKLDAGVVGVSQWWHVFLIERTDTGAVDILLSLSATAPTFPFNYSKKRRLGSVFVDGAGVLVDFVQDGDYFQWAVAVLDVNATNPGVAAVPRTLSVPTGVSVLAMVNVSLFQSITVLTTFAYLSDLAVSDQAPSQTGAPLGNTPYLAAEASSPNGQTVALTIRTNTAAQIRSRLFASDANTVLLIATTGWIDRRGRG